MTMTSNASWRAACSSGLAPSRAMARPSTRPPHAPSACTTRAAISQSIAGASAPTRLDTRNSANEKMSTGRRPKRSGQRPVDELSGMAMPTR